uniref:GTP-binding protein n=1 Tax=Dromaius novaehollandiae TaxID=8790 RepID=A0A8C4J7Y7_DRONO
LCSLCSGARRTPRSSSTSPRRGHLSSSGRPGLAHRAVTQDTDRPGLGEACRRAPPSPHQAAGCHGSWSSDSSGSAGAREPPYRVVLLGDPGVGKTSLVQLLAGVQERDPPEQRGDAYERTLCVDGEETALLVTDPWEPERRESRPGGRCLQARNAYVVVYSIMDQGSFESVSKLRVQLRRGRRAQDVPIILVGNKTNLARCREVSVEEGRACAAVFGCKCLETSAVLQHNVAELFEGVVRQIRLRRGGGGCPTAAPPRKGSLAARARCFLDRLVAGNGRKAALRVRSKSCHDLSML